MKTIISKCGEYKLEIYPEENHINEETPNDWGDDERFLVYSHRQFDVKRDGFDPQAIYQHLLAKQGVEGYKDEYDKTYDDYYIFPVAAYIHSGVALSLTDSFDKQGWDTSVTGMILVHKKDTDIEQAEKIASSLIDTWNTYLSGDVWCYTLHKAEKRLSITANNFQNLIDSGHGFDDYIRNEYFTEETEWNVVDSCGGIYGEENVLDEVYNGELPEDIMFEL